MGEDGDVNVPRGTLNGRVRQGAAEHEPMEHTSCCGGGTGRHSSRDLWRSFSASCPACQNGSDLGGGQRAARAAGSALRCKRRQVGQRVPHVDTEQGQASGGVSGACLCLVDVFHKKYDRSLRKQ